MKVRYTANGMLEEGEVYTVSSIEVDVDLTFYRVEGYNGCAFSASLFEQVVSESEEDERGFDGLVQVITEFPNGSWFNLNKLSDEQKNFLGRTLPSYNTDSWYWDFGAARYCNGLFSGSVLPVHRDNKELTFNQVFKYKEDL